MRPAPALLIVPFLLLAGCMGDDRAQTPAPDAPDGDPPQETKPGAGDSDPRREDSGGGNRSLLAASLVVASEGGELHVVRAADGAFRSLDLDDLSPGETLVSSIRWGPDGGLHGTIWGERAAVFRVAVSDATVTTVYEGEPLVQPLAVAPLPDGRLLVADGGRVREGPPALPTVETPRVVTIDPRSGEASVLAMDPRFDGPGENWMDLAVAFDGTVYLVTAASDHRVVTPEDTSDDDGTGALWRLDPGSGRHKLVSASPVFTFPESVTVLPDGSLAVAEWTEDPYLLRVDPDSGEATRIVQLSRARFLWGVEALPDGRIAVVDYCGDPMELGGPGCGPGAVWVVDPTGDVEPFAVSTPELSRPAHARLLPTGTTPTPASGDRDL